MKLIFSTAYDQEVFKKEPLVNTKYIGTLGLLNILERELGIYHITSNQQDRIRSYQECIEKCNTQTAFYWKAFDNDKRNVSKMLLKYRDKLIYCGWNQNLPKQPSRLEDLAVIEREFVKEKDYLAEADRWQQILKKLNTIPINELNISEIELHDPIYYLHPTLKIVFNKLKAVIKDSWNLKIKNGIDTNFSEIKTSLLNSFKSDDDREKPNKINLKQYNDDDSFLLLQFNNEQEINDAMAFYADAETHLFINEDNANFDFSLISLNKNAAGSSQNEANPQIIQLYKLIIPCFSKELNIETLYSLLQLPSSVSPIPNKLAYKLTYSLTRKPGIGNEDWNKIILDFKEGNNEDSELTEDVLKGREKLVKLFLTFENQSEDKRIKKARAILDYVIKWAKDKINKWDRVYRAKVTEQDTIEQFPYLIEQASYLIDLCESTIKEIKDKDKVEDVEKAFHSIYNSKKFKNFYKQKHSVEVIPNIEQLAEPCDKTVIWLDFYNKPLSSNYLNFLLNEEVKYLDQIKAFYPEEDQLNLIVHQRLRGLLNCKNKIIFCYVSEGENNEKHPFLIRLESLIKNLEESVNIKVKTTENLNILEKWSFSNTDDGVKSSEISLPEPIKYFESDIVKKIDRRPKESASSVEKFIQYPFDWVMQYVAEYSNHEGLKLQKDNLLKGNIAHKVIENLVNKWLKKPIGDLVVNEEEFNEKFNKVVEQEGAILLQSENKFDLSNFKFRLKRAINTLVNIINKNGLTIVSCEKEFGKDKECIISDALGAVTGSIDLLLEDQHGNPFVVDLKWSSFETKFKEFLEKGNALQLALYTAAIKKQDISKTGYFLLNQNKLMTSAYLKGSNVQIIPEKYSNQNILDKLRKSLEYRWNDEIKNGKLEMGETFHLKELQYYESGLFSKKGVNPVLISLPEKSSRKKDNPYTGFDLFKGAIN